MAALSLKLIGGDKSLHSQMFGTWGQVLAQGHDVDTLEAQVVHHGHHLLVPLPEAHDQTRLDIGTGPTFMNLAQQEQRALVVALGPHLPVEPGHRLDVVVEHMGGCLHHLGQGLPTPAEIRNQQLDRGEGGLNS